MLETAETRKMRALALIGLCFYGTGSPAIDLLFIGLEAVSIHQTNFDTLAYYGVFIWPKWGVYTVTIHYSSLVQ